jgi:hypothetical protein
MTSNLDKINGVQWSMNHYVNSNVNEVLDFSKIEAGKLECRF